SAATSSRATSRSRFMSCCTSTSFRSALALSYRDVRLLHAACARPPTPPLSHQSASAPTAASAWLQIRVGICATRHGCTHHSSVRVLLSVEAHGELLRREWLKQNRDQLALLLGDRCLMADVVGRDRRRRPERHCTLGFGEMLTNPGVPVHTGRNLLVPE